MFFFRSRIILVYMARPTNLTKGIHNSIVKSTRNGNYLTASALAVGIRPQVVTRWLQIGRGEHPTRPAKEPFITFSNDFDKARAEAEIRIVESLGKSEDWRARAWVLERGPARERWGINENPLSAQLPVIAVLDALRERQKLTNDQKIPLLPNPKPVKVIETDKE